MQSIWFIFVFFLNMKWKQTKIKIFIDEFKSYWLMLDLGQCHRRRCRRRRHCPEKVCAVLISMLILLFFFFIFYFYVELNKCIFGCADIALVPNNEGNKFMKNVSRSPFRLAVCLFAFGHVDICTLAIKLVQSPRIRIKKEHQNTPRFNTQQQTEIK